MSQLQGARYWQNPERAKRLRVHLESVLEEFLELNEIDNDAQAPARGYQDPTDQEFAAFVCGVIAYGRIAHIKVSIQKALKPLGSSPVQTLRKASARDIKKMTKGWVHRFNTEEDLARLLWMLKQVYEKHSSLESFLNPLEHENASDVLERLVSGLTGQALPNGWKPLRPKDSFWFFLPRPSSGGACKRLNLYLRWMVGSGPTDFALWSRFSKSKLIVPLDVHILRQSESLGFTTRKTPDWKCAEEITASLKLLDQEDPTRFDFALCHLGVNGTILNRRSF